MLLCLISGLCLLRFVWVACGTCAFVCFVYVTWCWVFDLLCLCVVGVLILGLVCWFGLAVGWRCCAVAGVVFRGCLVIAVLCCWFGGCLCFDCVGFGSACGLL